MKVYLFLFSLFIISLNSCKSPIEEAYEEARKEVDASTQEHNEASNNLPPGITTKSVNWPTPSDTLSTIEQSYLGTWASEITEHGLRSGGMGIKLAGNGKESETLMELASRAVAGIEENGFIREKCIWFELYDDHTGFWSSCMIGPNGPGSTQKMDIFNGTQEPLGLKFEWSADPHQIRFKLESNLHVTYINDSTEAQVDVVYWDLILGESSLGEYEGQTNYETQDVFPEFGYTHPFPNQYWHIPNLMDGKVQNYSKPLM